MQARKVTLVLSLLIFLALGYNWLKADNIYSFPGVVFIQPTSTPPTQTCIYQTTGAVTSIYNVNPLNTSCPSVQSRKK